MNKSIMVTAIVMLSLGLAVGGGLVWWMSPEAPTETRSHMEATNGDDAPMVKEKKILFYRHPMNPEISSPVPAKGSMGMDYIPVYADTNDDEDNDKVGTVKINPIVVQNMGVRTSIAKKESLSRTVRTVGRVDFNEERMLSLHPKVEGWIEDLYINKTGEHVVEDDILLSIYSPKLVSTQQEYLLALNNAETLSNSPFEEIKKGAQELLESSEERLRLFDVPEHQIQELKKTRKVKKNLHIHAPAAGTVINIGVRKGQYVTPKTELYKIVDLTEVWVYADIYDYELPWVNIGDEVEMTLSSVPGKTFSGSLAYIYPYAEAKTRTTKVRIVFDNQDFLLRPDMFVDVLIAADTQQEAIVIPAEAVVRSGNRVQVFVVKSPGKFEPRLVTLGIESNGKVAVLTGVEAGEEVVTSAQFLVDSESKLREATAKMMQSLKTSDK